MRVSHHSLGAGIVLRYEPLGSGMCDTLVRFDVARLPGYCCGSDETGRRYSLRWTRFVPGYECWVASHELRSEEGGGPAFRLRQEVRRQAAHYRAIELRGIRAGLIADWHKPWPGAEFGKAFIGQALDAAIKEAEEESR